MFAILTTAQIPLNTTGHPTDAARSTSVWAFVLIVLGGICSGAVIVLAAYALYTWYQKRFVKSSETAGYYDTKPRVSFTLPGSSVGSPTSLLSGFSDYPQVDINLLQPSLYISKDDDEQLPGSPFMGPGRLCFSLLYDKYAEKLRVKLLRATRLTPKGDNVTATPYVKIYLLPDKKRRVQSKVRQRTSNPDFNEDFVFTVPPEDLPSRTLKFTVCDFDRFSRQQVIGHVYYQLTDVDFLVSEEGTGEIWLDITEKDSTIGIDKGQLLFSLQFLPTASRLTVAVLKAKDLKLEDEHSDMDPYVKVSMIMGGKAVKKRKTTICRKTCAPVYNEAFSFTIPPACLERVSFVLSVTASPWLGGNKKLIGRAIVGPYMYSTGSGLAHWNDMLASPRSAVAQWHTLI